MSGEHLRKRRNLRKGGERLALRLRHRLGGGHVRHAPRTTAASASAGRTVPVRARRVRGLSGSGLGVRVPGGLHRCAVRACARRVRVGAVPQRRALRGRRGLVGVRVRGGLGGRHVRGARAGRVQPAVPAARHLRARRRPRPALRLPAAARAFLSEMLRM